MAETLLVLNGPNLNLLGVREPEIYGRDTLADIEALCVAQGRTRGFEIDFRQSNSEATLIDWLHEARATRVGVAINPAGLSFHSIPLLDALKLFDGPKVEIHITNIHRREPMYQKSLISHGVTGVIAGLGATGYALAIDALAALIKAGKS
jgi:3-dehydroquinate dehydratase II